MAKYRLGRGSRKHVKRRAWRVISVLLFVGLVGVCGLVLWLFMNASTEEVTQPQTITHEYVAPEETGKLFEETNFSLRLPDDWKLQSRDTTIYNYYKFQATQKNADNRWLEIYIDKFPTDIAFNRLLPVRVESDSFVLAGAVSDNCVKFTDKALMTGSSGTAPSKWAEVSFSCDIARSSRNLVGVGAIGQGQQVVLTGQKTGKHTYVFIYTDHNISPNYQILENMVESFKVK